MSQTVHTPDAMCREMRHAACTRLNATLVDLGQLQRAALELRDERGAQFIADAAVSVELARAHFEVGT